MKNLTAQKCLDFNRFCKEIVWLGLSKISPLCRIVDLTLENLEQAENKNAAATYRYRVDCDGAWGEIHFDFENKIIKIRRLADWDTIRSHKYAWKVIGFVALKEDKVLPEKKRLIFWDKSIGQKKKRCCGRTGV